MARPARTAQTAHGAQGAPNARAVQHVRPARSARPVAFARRVREVELTLEATLPDGARVPVRAVRKGGVKRVTLSVSGDGQVRATIPLRAGEAGVRLAEQLIEQKAAWIARVLERTRGGIDWRHPEQAVRAGDGGRIVLPLWGEPVDARGALGLGGDAVEAPGAQGPDGTWETPGPGGAASACGQAGSGGHSGLSADAVRDRSDAVEDDEGGSGIDAITALGDPDDLARRVRELYRAEVARRLPEIAARAQREMGIEDVRWSVRYTVSKWGSCTPARRSIRVSATLAAYPPELLDLVVRHELVHLWEASHGARFHELLERYRPRHREVARLLGLPPCEAARRLHELDLAARPSPSRP